MPLIYLPYGNNSFNSDDLTKHIRGTGRNYIIQGQKACRRIDHPKPNSLDCWLRDNYAQNPDTKQAVNEVIAALVNRRDFAEGKFYCPDSGRRAKGVRIVTSLQVQRMPPSQGQNKETTEIMKASDFSGDLSAFLSRYNYQPDLTARLDNLEGAAIDQSLINDIVLWKLNRYVKVNDDILGMVAGLRHLRAGDHRKSKQEIDTLMRLDGVDLPMASTILRFINPRVFQIIDRHAYRAVYGKKYPLYPSTSQDRKTSLYFDYIDQLIKLCEAKGMAFTTIDRVLYIFDKENNGKL